MKRVHFMKKPFRFLMLFVFIVMFSLSANAQQQVTGKVTNAESGEPLPGVNITSMETTTGTITDNNGEYSIEVASDATLVFSFVGYQKKEVAVEGRSTIDVALKSEAQELEDVIVIGYGTQKKSDKTGAVSNVQSEELKSGIMSDPIESIQGKTAGVLISKTGGDPNSGFSVKIRGSSGLSSNTEPLYVVDGVPGVDPTTISSDNIKSFDVLKDASSTAIYGSRGANGVIMITTKKGSDSKGSRLEVNSSVSFDQVANRLDLMSAEQLRNFSDDQGLGLSDGGASTDWQDEIYRQGMKQKYHIAASGGNDTTNYRASLAHNKYKGVIIGSGKNRTIGRLNLQQKAIQNRLTLNATISATIEGNDYVNYGSNGDHDVLYQAFQRNPTDPVYTEEGNYYETQRAFNYNNPVALAKDIQNKRDAKRYMGNLKADFKITEGLTIGTNLAYTRDDEEYSYFEPRTLRATKFNGFAQKRYENYESKLLETTVNYNNTFADLHNIDAVAGYSYQREEYTGMTAQGNEPLSEYVQANNLGALNEVNKGDVDSYKGANKLISFFGRVAYNYDSRYYITATLRRDGSSKFGDNNEWGLFPSGSVKWNIKNEDFLKDNDLIGQLALRAGFGLTGNQEIGNYHDIMSYVVSGSTVNFETGEEAIQFSGSHNANPDLKWEENREYNIGLDFGFFNNRISGTVEYYDKYTYDLIAEYAVDVPPNIRPNTWANAGAISNKGIELMIQAFAVNTDNVDWKTSVTFSKNDQVVESLSSEDGKFEWSEADKKKGWLSGRGLVGSENWTQYLEEGSSLGTFYMPEYAGLSSDGKFLFYTKEGGVTRNVGEAERRKVGSALPDFKMTWNNRFTLFDNLDVNFTLRAVQGFDLMNNTRMVFANPTIVPTINGLEEVIDETERGLNDQPKVSDYYLEDGSFIKLDNVTIGYNFDVNTVSWLRKARVFVTGSNLVTFTDYSGIDPEISYNTSDDLSFGIDSYNVYPKTRSFSLGAKLTF